VVLRASCSYRQRLEGLLEQRGVTGLRRLEFGTLEAVIGCVAAGLGVTLLPRRMIGAHWLTGKLAIHDLPRDQSQVETQFIRRRDVYASSALEAFIAEARESLGSFSPVTRQSA
jgi:DNA-binding transcriptional LysR family regulator